MYEWLNRFFGLEKRQTTLGREVRGAVATFLTMSYIIFVNPRILQGAGVPFDSAIACTAAAAGICCLLMGLSANFPMALASGMGLNAVVAALARTPEVGSWQVAMGLVVLDGLVVLVLVLCGLRDAMMHAIPRDLRRALGASIGLFIAFIGLVNAKLVVVPTPTIEVLSKDAGKIMPPVTFGDLRSAETVVAFVGLLITGLLLARGTRGALLIGIACGTVLAYILGLAQFEPLRPPSFENAFQANVGGALQWHLVPVLFALLMVDFFDTLGSVTAISEQAGLHDEEGRVPGLRNILAVDAISASVGGLLGASSVTSYIESAAGVQEGARTGLSTVIVGLFFLLAIFLAPLVALVPLIATAPVLILLGFLMGAQITRINFADLETGIPAFLTLITVPLTYSIAHGIGFGFLSYVVIKVCSGKATEVKALMYLAAGLFLAYFVWGH